MPTTRKARGFDHLETASRIVEAWPEWKKELAGISNSSNKPECQVSSLVSSTKNQHRKLK